jgi:SAM-dependent methyltransferase
MKNQIKICSYVIWKYSPYRSYVFFRDYFRILKILRLKLKTKEIFINDHHPESFEKYLNYRFWLLENLTRIFDLGLESSSKKLKVLDIGTGFGYFPFLCSYYGHDAMAIDLNDNEMYNDVIKKLNVKRHVRRIERNIDIEINEKFDLITAFMICFNNHKTEDIWNENDWTFFINSLKENNLNQPGTIFLSFNLEFDGKPFNNSLYNFFDRSQYEIDSNKVLIRFSN